MSLLQAAGPAGGTGACSTPRMACCHPARSGAAAQPAPGPVSSSAFCCCHQVCRSSCGHGRAVAAASVWSELGAALLGLALGHVPQGGTSS